MPDVVTAKVTDAKGQVRFGKTLIWLTLFALVDFGLLGLLFALVDFWFALSNKVCIFSIPGVGSC